MHTPSSGMKLTCITGAIRLRRSGAKGNKTRWVTIIDKVGTKVSFKVPDDIDQVDYEDLKDAAQHGLWASLYYDAQHFAYTIEIFSPDEVQMNTLIGSETNHTP